MPAYFDTGFCVREASWHRQETLLTDYPENWDDARRAAGLMWEPRLVPLYRRNGDEYVETPGAKLVERDDTDAPLGVVSDRFELLTHAEMGPIMEAILDEPNARYETAGSVKGGRMVWALIRLDEGYEIDGDVDGFGDPVRTYPYLTLLNSHDGTGACKVLSTNVRVVCWNTIQAASAEGDRTGAQFTFRHTAGMKDRIEEAKQALTGARADALRWREMAEALGTIKVTEQMVQQFLSEFIPAPPAGVVSDRVMSNVERDRAKFLHVLNDSATNAAMAGTGLGLVNAAVEFLDHVRGFQSPDTYMGRQILRPEPLKAKAVSLVHQLALAN